MLITLKNNRYLLLIKNAILTLLRLEMRSQIFKTRGGNPHPNSNPKSDPIFGQKTQSESDSESAI